MIIVFIIFMICFGLMFWAQCSDVKPDGMTQDEFEKIRGIKK